MGPPPGEGPTNQGHPLFEIMHLDFFLPTIYQCMGLREYRSWACYALTCYGFSTFMPFVTELRAKVLLAEETERRAGAAFRAALEFRGDEAPVLTVRYLRAP